MPRLTKVFRTAMIGDYYRVLRPNFEGNPEAVTTWTVEHDSLTVAAEAEAARATGNYGVPLEDRDAVLTVKGDSLIKTLQATVTCQVGTSAPISAVLPRELLGDFAERVLTGGPMTPQQRDFLMPTSPAKGSGPTTSASGSASES